MIAEIRLKQYRSYSDRSFKLSPGVNIVVGPNASGKTNLLEAIMVVCRGSSYRAPDNELIMHGKEWARIDAKSIDSTRTVKLVNGDRPNKEFLVDNKTFKRLGINEQIPIVLFEPNHLQMLSGSPELRRGYLDGILDNIKPNYKKFRKDYAKTLRQRNALLKSGRANSNSLFPWNVRLSHLGGFIALSRSELSNELNKNITAVYRSLASSKDQITLRYMPVVNTENYESLLLNKLETATEIDKLRGFTSYGPHREDINILINKKTPSQSASRGEVRSIIIALKTLEAFVIKKELGLKPIVLMDDVFSELDDNRNKQLSRILNSYQSIITSTNQIVKTSLKGPNIIKIQPMIH